jgi:hypothetical protein
MNAISSRIQASRLQVPGESTRPLRPLGPSSSLNWLEVNLYQKGSDDIDYIVTSLNFRGWPAFDLSLLLGGLIDLNYLYSREAAGLGQTASKISRILLYILGPRPNHLDTRDPS